MKKTKEIIMIERIKKTEKNIRKKEGRQRNCESEIEKKQRN